ncbi:precorrin-6A/cobalt-precorrin-6A reductase [Histidinibacterium lentulum]|uniref:precorrin-6A/cobalt-precorrin-6A reductase n=1 Tax=Histidinibacterium lentulum TaxID=2480588 RepID=UPI001C84AD07|nr:precorrin-6A/cobalt-precorrin-6A reductase [Histidinibacterium lentulum]
MILLLAGTAEARALAEALTAEGIATEASLAGVTRAARPLAVPVRTGGFGGAEGFADWLRARGARGLVDATHPFALRIGPRSAAVCRALGVPYLRLLRQPWAAGPGDDWREVAGPEEVARIVPEGAAVFLALGAQHLADWACLAGRRVVARQLDPPEGPAPFAGLERIAAPPGESVAEEVGFLQRKGIEWVVTRNSGGPARAKLAAARELGLPVLMIPRPPPPVGVEVVADVAGAMDWVRAL